MSTQAPILQHVQTARDRDHSHIGSRADRGSGWFYWIAGLSVINSLVMFFGINWGFALGLAVNDFITVALEDSSRGLALVLELLVIGLFVGLGVFASRKQRWAFVVGGLLFALDTLLMLLEFSIIGVIIHLVALWAFFKGFQACGEWKKACRERGIPV